MKKVGCRFFIFKRNVCFLFSSIHPLGLVTAHTSSEMHSPHLIQTLKTKPGEGIGFTPVISQHEVRADHVGSSPRPLSNHVGHRAETGPDRETPPHHLGATGDFDMTFYPSCNFFQYIM